MSFVAHANFEGENSTQVIFIKYALNIGLCSETCEQISVKLGILTDMTDLHIDIILNDLDPLSSQGYRVMRKVDPMKLCCCKV